jgi:hypothetical protein
MPSEGDYLWGHVKDGLEHAALPGRIVPDFPAG